MPEFDAADRAGRVLALARQSIVERYLGPGRPPPRTRRTIHRIHHHAYRKDAPPRVAELLERDLELLEDLRLQVMRPLLADLRKAVEARGVAAPRRRP